MIKAAVGFVLQRLFLPDHQIFSTNSLWSTVSDQKSLCIDEYTTGLGFRLVDG
jgi:hypothetical protein